MSVWGWFSGDGEFGLERGSDRNGDPCSGGGGRIAASTLGSKADRLERFSGSLGEGETALRVSDRSRAPTGVSSLVIPGPAVEVREDGPFEASDGEMRPVFAPDSDNWAVAGFS